MMQEEKKIFTEPNGKKWATEFVDIGRISWGDTVVFRGELATVGKADLKTGGFHGRSLFGDSFRGGSLKVQRAIKVIQEP